MKTYFMQGLVYDNIIPEIESLFPEFANDIELKELAAGLPAIYLSFLISYAYNNWDDLSIWSRLATLMNELAQSKNENTKIVFLDFAVDFYRRFEEHRVNVDSFLNSLLPKTKEFIEYRIEFWKKGKF